MTHLNALFDITIIGGGPIGGLFALRLLQKCHTYQAPPLKIALVDQVSLESLLTPTHDGRTFALTPSAFRLLTNLGLWKNLEPFAAPILDILVRQGHDSTSIHYDHRVLKEPFGYIIESTILRREIFKKLQQSPEVTFFSPHKLTSLKKTPSHLELFLEEGSSFETRLLVGADGRSSKVRELLSFETFHFPYPQHALVCHFQHTQPHCGWAMESFYEEGPFAVLPLKGTSEIPHQSGIVWASSKEEIDRLSMLSIPEFNTALSLKLDLPHYGAPALLSKRWTYPLSAHVSPNLITQRAVLLGDAAHGIHPVAGQGLNLGIRDVESLSEEISTAISLGLDPGSSIGLQNFQRTRRIDILSLLGVTHFLIHLFSSQSRFLRFLRQIGLQSVNTLPSFKKFLIQEAIGKL